MAVCHDLRESNFYYDYEGYRFYFSSDFYLKKFKEKLDGFVEQSIIKFLGINKLYIRVAGLKSYFGVALYQKVEKRGFRVVKDGEELEVKVNWQDAI